MKQLIEDYQRRLTTIEQMAKDYKKNNPYCDVNNETLTRYGIKAGEYRAFLTELERCDKNNVDTNDYFDLIGKEVVKCSIGKKIPNGNKFKSGLTANTVKGIVKHLILDIPAFIFIEDDSFVECRRCTELK